MTEHTPLLRALRRSRIPMVIGCLLLCGRAWADIDVDVKGVNDELRRNVLTYLSFARYKKRPNIDRDTLDPKVVATLIEPDATPAPAAGPAPVAAAAPSARPHTPR